MAGGRRAQGDELEWRGQSRLSLRVCFSREMRDILAFLSRLPVADGDLPYFWEKTTNHRNGQAVDLSCGDVSRNETAATTTMGGSEIHRTENARWDLTQSLVSAMAID